MNGIIYDDNGCGTTLLLSVNLDEVDDRVSFLCVDQPSKAHHKDGQEDGESCVAKVGYGVVPFTSFI